MINATKSSFTRHSDVLSLTIKYKVNLRHEKFERELKLLLMLTENRKLTADDICQRLDISRRMFYYYLESFRLFGFIVQNHRPYYSIDRSSPYFQRLFRTIHFTEDEAETMRRLLDSVSDQSLQVRHLKEKLSSLYDLDILNTPELQEQAAENVSLLYDAIRQHRQVILKDYSSPHSDTLADRHVEPFLFLNYNNEIRCYEPRSQMNKTFKISRIGHVELLDLVWEHEADHRQMFTDIFQFSGELTMPVELRLDRLSYSILVDEYPQSADHITPDGENHWHLKTSVVSYAPITRFVLGLHRHIQVMGSDDFRHHISIEKTSIMAEKT